MTPLAATGLVKSFGAAEVLRGCDVTLTAGSVVWLEATPGAGATTLLRCLHRTYRPDAGAVVLDGDVDLAAADARTVTWLRRSCIGLVERRVLAPPREPASEVIARVLRRRGTPAGAAADRAAETLAEAGARDLAGVPFGALASADRALVGLLAALVAPPAVLLVDDPPLESLAPAARNHLDGLVDEARARGHALLVAAREPPRGADVRLRLEEGRVIG